MSTFRAVFTSQRKMTRTTMGMMQVVTMSTAKASIMLFRIVWNFWVTPFSFSSAELKRFWNQLPYQL